MTPNELSTSIRRAEKALTALEATLADIAAHKAKLRAELAAIDARIAKAVR